MRLFLHTKKIALVRFLFTSGSHRTGFSASGVRIGSASECIGSVSVRSGFGSDRLRFAQGSNRSTSDYTGSVSVCSGFGSDLFGLAQVRIRAVSDCIGSVSVRFRLGYNRFQFASGSNWPGFGLHQLGSGPLRIRIGFVSHCF